MKTWIFTSWLTSSLQLLTTNFLKSSFTKWNPKVLLSQSGNKIDFMIIRKVFETTRMH